MEYTRWKLWKSMNDWLEAHQDSSVLYRVLEKAPPIKKLGLKMVYYIL